MAFETDVGQVASLAQSVRNGPAYTEACSDLSDRKERLNTHVGLGRLAVGDTGATNLASQGIVRRGFSVLACFSPFLISRACDGRKSRLTLGKRPVRSSGPRGRRFESCLPDQSAILTRHLPLPVRIGSQSPQVTLLSAAIFGAGWGIAGICPGPALVNLGRFAPGAAVFVSAMLGGMPLFP